MALQKAHTVHGMSFPNAYFEIISIRGSKPRQDTLVNLRIFSDATKEHEIGNTDARFPYTPDATVAWAYNQLKTLPEFADAVDV